MPKFKTAGVSAAWEGGLVSAGRAPQSAGQFLAFSGPSQTPSPQGDAALPGVAGRVAATGLEIASVVDVELTFVSIAAGGLPCGAGVNVPVNEQARLNKMGTDKRTKQYLIG